MTFLDTRPTFSIWRAVNAMEFIMQYSIALASTQLC